MCLSLSWIRNKEKSGFMTTDRLRQGYPTGVPYSNYRCLAIVPLAPGVPGRVLGKPGTSLWTKLPLTTSNQYAIQILSFFLCATKSIRFASATFFQKKQLDIDRVWTNCCSDCSFQMNSQPKMSTLLPLMSTLLLKLNLKLL
uniref:Uncharacterized protein n=1 Tax=Molossus molossus TaxID=27622 RepID=A0A7J8E2L0_MOLMO|nr:hypothetical protein HJG59_009039 [Molossus molossus]